MARIRHIAIFSDDPENLAQFYVKVFGMTVKGKSNNDAANCNADRDCFQDAGRRLHAGETGMTQEGSGVSYCSTS